MQSISYHKYSLIYFQKMKLHNYGLRLLLFSLLAYLSFINLPIEINATTTYYDNCEMYLTGTLIYRGSSTGFEPVDNLHGRTLKIYLNGEAERTLAKEPYLTNLCSQNVEGWIEAGYEISIPYSDRLHVSQKLYTNTSQRDGTAYYDVEVEKIQTNLLYRPERNNTYITAIVLAIVIYSIICLLKVARHD